MYYGNICKKYKERRGEMKETRILLAVAIISLLTIFSSAFWTEMGSLIDEAVRDKSNPMVVGEKIAKQSGVNHSNPLIVTMTMKQIDKGNLLAVINASQIIKNFFSERGLEVSVASLATIPDYRAEEIDNFLTVTKITVSGFNPEQWFTENKNRRILDKSFLGKTDDGVYYTNFIIFPKQGENEILIAKTWLLCKAGWSDYHFDWWQHWSEWSWQNVRRYLALNFFVEVPLSEQFLKFQLENEETGENIKSQANISLSANGWSFLRLVIDGQARLGSYLSLSLAFVALILFSLVSLGTWRKVIVSLSVIGLAFIWSKGFIGILQQLIDWAGTTDIHWLRWLANDFFMASKEDVFSIEAYFAILISGISFPWHYLRKFNGVRRKFPCLSYEEAWEFAKKKVKITVLIKWIAVFDFLLGLSVANRHGAQAMWMVGLIASVGVYSAWWLTHNFLPIFYYYLGGETDSRREKQNRLSVWAENLVKSFCIFLTRKWIVKKHSATIALTIFLLTVISSILLIPSFLKMDNNLEKFIAGSSSEKIYRQMNRPGGTGSTLFRPFIRADLLDTKTLDDLRLYQEAIDWNSRMTWSPLIFFLEILEVDYGYQRGNSIAELLLSESDGNPEEARLLAKDIWQDILDNDTAEVLPSLLSPSLSGIEMLTSSAESGTVELTELRDKILLGLQSQFSHLKIAMSGKISQYLEIDRIISSGQQFWQWMSQLAIILFCAFWAYWRNKSLAGKWQMSPTGYGFSVAVPFIFSTAMLYLLLMVLGLPNDIATASISSMAVSIAIDFPLFITDFFQKSLAEVKLSGFLDKEAREMAFCQTVESDEVVNATTDVIFDYLGNAILFSFMMFTPVEGIWRCGILEEWVLLNCIFATIFLVLPMLRWTIQGRQEEGSIPRMLRIADSPLNNAPALFAK